jgi:hypothetical protein
VLGGAGNWVKIIAISENLVENGNLIPQLVAINNKRKAIKKRIKYIKPSYDVQFNIIRRFTDKLLEFYF